MMNPTWFRFTAFIAVLALWTEDTTAYTYIKKAHTAEDNSKCVYADGVVGDIGQVWYDLTKCEVSTCSSIRNKIYEFVSGCGAVSAGKGCEIVEGTTGTERYPNCCPQVKCDNFLHEFDGSENIVN